VSNDADVGTNHGVRRYAADVDEPAHGPEAFLDETRSGGDSPRDLGDAVPARRATRPGDPLVDPAPTIEPPSIPDGTFVKVRSEEHPLPRACEVTVNFQDYHRSSSKLGRFGKIVGIDDHDGEYLVMLDNFECVAVPMRRVEWRKVAT
jgi:hypothetical protein